MKLEIGVFLVFVFFACFQTWRDEHHVATKAQNDLTLQTKPRFEGGIDSVIASRPDSDGDSVVLITAHVKNLGAPSIAVFPQCQIRTASGKQVEGEFGPVPFQLAVTFDKPKHSELQPALIYTREENLLIRASSTPIPNGGAVTGWVYVTVHGISADDVLVPGTYVHLIAKDVHDQPLALDFMITADSLRKGIPTFSIEGAPDKEEKASIGCQGRSSRTDSLQQPSR